MRESMGSFQRSSMKEPLVVQWQETFQELWVSQNTRNEGHSGEPHKIRADERHTHPLKIVSGNRISVFRSTTRRRSEEWHACDTYRNWRKPCVEREVRCTWGTWTRSLRRTLSWQRGADRASDSTFFSWGHPRQTPWLLYEPGQKRARLLAIQLPDVKLFGDRRITHSGQVALANAFFMPWAVRV